MLAFTDNAPKAEPGIHHVAAEMRDIILGKAADGLPTMDTDLEHFTVAEIKEHFPAARRAANAQLVRQVGDDPCYETRDQLLNRAKKLLFARMPTATEMHAVLRTHGIANSEIADLWPELMADLGEMLPNNRPLPQLRAVS